MTTSRFERRYRLSRCSDTSKPALVATDSSVRLSASLSRPGGSSAWISTDASVFLRQPPDLLDVGALGGERRRDRVQVRRAQRRPDGGDDVAAPVAGVGAARAVAVGGRDRLEVQLHAQLLGREQQLLEHVARLRDADQQAQRELSLHHHLLDVVQRGALLRRGCRSASR